MRISDNDSYVEGDFSEPDNGSSYNPIDEQNNENNDGDGSGHMNFSQALDALQQQRENCSQSSQIDENNLQGRPMQHDLNIDFDEFINDRYDEYLGQRMQEDESEQQRTDIRLTAPPGEVRHRPKQPKRTPPSKQIDVAAQLRTKQLQLVDVQVKVQKLLLENATIAKKEALERLAMATALRKCAELDLSSKMRQHNEHIEHND